MWFVRRVIDQVSRFSSDALELYSFHPGPMAALFLGVVVDAPSRQQFHLLKRFERLLGTLKWDGAQQTLRDVISEPCARIRSDNIAQRTGRDKLEGGGISLGGVAYCTDMTLIAFRLGRFRVVAGDRVLTENTLYHQEMSPGETLAVTAPEITDTRQLRFMLQAAVRSLPEALLADGDFLQTDPSRLQRVRVYHSYVFDAEENEERRIDMEAVWRE